MTLGAIQQLLGSRENLVHYDVENYEEDLETLEEIDRL